MVLMLLRLPVDLWGHAVFDPVKFSGPGLVEIGGPKAEEKDYV